MTPRTNHPRRLAPYARGILNQQRAGRNPNVYLFAGSDGWNQAEYRRRNNGEGSALVLPPDEEPETYIWPRLDALLVIPGDCSGDRFRRLAVALLAAGCRCVTECRPDPQRPGWGLPPVSHYSSADAAREAA